MNDSDPIDTLPVHLSVMLWNRLHRDLVRRAPPPPPAPLAEHLKSLIASHGWTWTQVCLTLATDVTPQGMDLLEHLIGRPMYLCARGETGQPLVDFEGRLLPTPVGRRRGEPPAVLRMGDNVRRRLRGHARNRTDNRILRSVAPNPKDPAKQAWHRYERYTVGRSLEYHVQHLGVLRSDIRWDIAQGHIIATPPTPEERADEYDRAARHSGGADESAEAAGGARV